MKNVLSCAVIFLLFVSGVNAAEQLTISITAPKKGVEVNHRYEVSGKVSDSKADVWVVVRPMEQSDFWVQPPVTVDNDGTWKVTVYFGEAGLAHVGKRFEVRAFANPTGKISEGKTAQWPKASAQSNVVEVVRK
jgi:hypothetical protein